LRQGLAIAPVRLISTYLPGEQHAEEDRSPRHHRRFHVRFFRPGALCRPAAAPVAPAEKKVEAMKMAEPAKAEVAKVGKAEKDVAAKAAKIKSHPKPMVKPASTPTPAEAPAVVPAAK
jgi:hypothetical protein